MIETEVGVMHFRDRGRGQQSRNTGSLSKMEKSKKLILPWSFQKEYSPATILILIYKTHFRLQTSRTLSNL